MGLLGGFSTAARAGSYLETNLTSDIPGLAPNTDASLKNPWGLGFSATSPFWSGNQIAAKSSLLTATGAAGPVGPVNIQPQVAGSSTSGPTGVVNNSVNGVATTDFKLSNGAASQFIFANLNGTISGWNGALGATGPAEVAFTSSNNASYTGLAIANNGSQNLLYAADNRNAAIDVIGPTFTQVALPGNFTDPNLAGFKPYNIQFLNGRLYVTYQNLPNGTFAIDYFDTNGVYQSHTSTDSHLLSPWGITLAPSTFGEFGGDLLVGNKSNGQINAFDPTTLAFLGTLSTANGQPLTIPGGLWALAFRTGGGGFDTNTLYFTTGLTPQAGNIFADGLFGTITAVPEPSSIVMLGLGLIVVCGVRKARARNSRLVDGKAVGAAPLRA
jgi:uncharacterized protein (TIGR03118 family)